MYVTTSHFGEIEISEEDILVFNQGIPGFEDIKSYVLIQVDEGIPFMYLQAIEDSAISFIVTNPFLFFPDYDFQLPEAAGDELGIHSVEQVEVWSIITLNEQMTQATANLLAPIIINKAGRLGKQVVLHDSGYQVRHQIPLADAEETNQSEGGK